jgi:hypothetical protein
MSHDPETSATSSPRASAPSRRTILTGAAWSVPVIAAASIAPIASASGVTALAFDKATYNGTACGTITGAYVTVTVGGVPTAGQSVTVTLSDGYTFSGGATTTTQVTGTDGRANLPAINVPAVGGSATLSASVLPTTTATASVTSASSSSTWIARDSRTSSGTFSNVPTSATPLAGWGYFLDGTTLWYNNAILDTNVTKVSSGSLWNSTGGLDWVQYLKGSTWTHKDNRGSSGTFSNVPTSATPLAGWGYFLDGTTLWYNNAILDTNVTKVSSGSLWDSVGGNNWAQYLRATAC